MGGHWRIAPEWVIQNLRKIRLSETYFVGDLNWPRNTGIRVNIGLKARDRSGDGGDRDLHEQS
jgi:hypothetical protein